MLSDFYEKLSSLNTFLFSGADKLIENTGLPDWVCDAVIDSVHTLPFLFLVFVFIEIF